MTAVRPRDIAPIGEGRLVVSGGEPWQMRGRRRLVPVRERRGKRPQTYSMAVVIDRAMRPSQIWEDAR